MGEARTSEVYTKREAIARSFIAFLREEPDMVVVVGVRRRDNIRCIYFSPLGVRILLDLLAHTTTFVSWKL